MIGSSFLRLDAAFVSNINPSTKRHPDVRPEKETENTTEQTRQELNGLVTGSHPSPGPVKWYCEEKTDREHPKDAAQSEDQDVKEGFERRANGRKNQQHKSRAAGGAVHHARKQGPEPGVRPSGMVMRVARKMDVPVTVRLIPHGLVRVIVPVNVCTRPGV